MAVIDVSQAQAGMVLAADVVDKRGRMLIPAGKELAEKYLNALPQWGITRIEVEGDDVADAVTEVEPWALDEAASEIDQLFAQTNRAHPAMDALAQACVQRRAEQIQGAAEGGEA